MDKLYYYRDNILNKIETNKEIDNTLKFLSYHSSIDDDIEIRMGKNRKNRMIIDRKLLMKLLEKIKEENNEHIDRYLALSFDSENYYKKLSERRKNE